jgi:hypothetical protein
LQSPYLRTVEFFIIILGFLLLDNYFG